MLLFVRLRYRVGTVEQEDGYLLIGLFSNIHCTVKPLGRLLPFNLPRRDLDAMALASIAKLHQQDIAAHHDRNPLKGIAMLGHGLAGRQAQTANQGISLLEHDFVGHCLQVSAKNPGTVYCALSWISRKYAANTSIYQPRIPPMAKAWYWESCLRSTFEASP